jgi:hypothetical protein
MYALALTTITSHLCKYMIPAPKLMLRARRSLHGMQLREGSNAMRLNYPFIRNKIGTVEIK